MPTPTVAQRAARIKLLILDIDGVLTDARVIYDSQGKEIKFFDVTDGHGIKLLQRAGVDIIWLSGRESKVNRLRGEELGISEIHEDAKIKLPVLEDIMARHKLAPQDIAYMGDDLIDLPAMKAVGLSLAPANARPEVKSQAHWIARRRGGHGAVRDACELLLRSLGAWEQVTERYFPPDN